MADRAVPYDRATLEWIGGDEDACIDCEAEKPVSEFYPSGKYLNSRCKPCCNEASRRYGKENREKRNARLREWRRRNPDAAREKDARARYKRKYGLTPGQVSEMKDAQDGRLPDMWREG